MDDSKQPPLHWGIVGGGMLGLTLALRLSQAGYRVTVLEAAKDLGGLASAWQVGDVIWDRYYHVTMLSDAKLRALLRELELESEIKWAVTKTNFFTGSAMYPLNNSIDYMRLPVLGLIDKLRLATTIIYGSRITEGLRLESLSAEEWLTKLSGRRAYQNLWRPLLRSKLGSNYTKASAAFIWSVIRRFYAARRGGLKEEMFGYVPGGYGKILAAMEAQLKDAGVVIETGARVTSIEREQDAIQVRGGDHAFTFDRVINTCAGPIVAQTCQGLSEAEHTQHNNITYQGIVCASLVLTRPLGGAYLTYITDDTLPFTTVIEMSSLVDRSLLGEHYLVYLPKYLPVDDPLLSASDEEVKAQFLEGLRRMFPDLSDADIKAIRVTRTRYVVPLSTKHYSSNLPAMASSVPGLYIINSAQIVNASLTVDDTVNLANRGAKYVIDREHETLA